MSELSFKDKKAPLMRRVQGYHDLRLDGIGDLVSRARDATVFDIGCNRGLAGFEFAQNGAKRVYGCDVYEDGIIACRHLFCDLRSVRHRFEVVDLTGGAAAMKKAFGSESEMNHDITLMLATFHKLKRIMKPNDLTELVKYFGARTAKYLGWRGYPDEMPVLDRDLEGVGLRRIHTSYISDIQPAAIWARR